MRTKYLLVANRNTCFPEKTATPQQVNIGDMISEQSLLRGRHNELYVLASRVAQGMGHLAKAPLMVSTIGSRWADGEYREPDPYATEMPFVTELWPR